MPLFNWKIINAVMLVLAVLCLGTVFADEEVRSLDSALEESEVLKLLRDQAAQQDKRLEELTRRLNKELHSMEEHFTTMFDKIKSTEDTLEENLRRVEDKVLGKVKKYDEDSRSASGGWVMPFIVLLVVIILAAAFFGYMYQKATKHTHML